MKMPGKAALILLFSGLSAFAAQTEFAFDLDGPWAMQRGDDPHWAEPGFDDSAWPRISGRAFADVLALGQRDGIRWYRQRVHSPEGAELAFEIGPIDGAYEVYVNGRAIGSFGRFPPHAAWYAARGRLFRIPDGSTDLLIAIRIYRWKMPATWPKLGVDYTARFPRLGNEAALGTEVSLRNERVLLRQFPGFQIAMFCFVVGCIALRLYTRERSEVQHFWLGISLVFTGFDGVAWLLSANTTAFPVAPYLWMDCSFVGIQQYAAILYLGTVISRRPPIVVRILAAGFMTAMILIAAAFSTGSERLNAINVSLLDIWAYGAVLLGLVVAVKTSWRREPNSLVLAAGVTAFEFSIIWAFRLRRTFPSLPVSFDWGLFSVRISDLGILVFAICMFYVLVTRVLRLNRERERLSREFEAARRLQTMLVPGRSAETPGFVVNADYTPAHEVGGDFYQILPADDGSVLVVVGDVSGKGLRAAMLVSHIIGGLRHEPSRKPAEVLTHLNRGLSSQTDGGFVTCACALLDRRGAVTLANAGHIYPYLNCEEVEVASGLPLGLIEDADYPETRFEIFPGDRLTFVSDGVVEARNESGELFGFERTRKVSRQAAAEISKAAQAFGQNDDITVVTISMQGA
jgi:sigma-B regulation protein RsbU (phosphoserine phosphatase)